MSPPSPAVPDDGDLVKNTMMTMAMPANATATDDGDDDDGDDDDRGHVDSKLRHQGKYVNDNGSRSPDDGTGKIPPAMMMAMGHHDSEGARPSLTGYIGCHYCWTAACGLWC